MEQVNQMPGPGFLSSLKWGLRFKRNYIEPLDELFKQYGDYVKFTGGPPVVALFHPDAVEHVLKKNHKNYCKPRTMQELWPVLGKGLLTSDGEEWKKHRQIIAPEFQHKKVEAFFLIMQKHLQVMIDSWKEKHDAFDIAPEISRATFAIAGECFFGAHVEESAEIIYRSIEFSSSVAVRRMSMPITNLPLWLPLPTHVRLHRVIADMDAVVNKIIDERMQNPTDAQDVLSRLVRGNNETKLSRQQIRDEVMTLLLAGHETTANALSWTLYLLGRHPEIQRKLADEVRSAIAGEIPTMEELRKLRYTKMVLEESMRLFPPAASIGRQAIDEDSIAGFHVPRTTVVNLAQWITHRHPDFWERPEEFNPERFAMSEKIHPYAYFPFAAGPRECVGKNMAMIEGIALLAGMVRNFDFRLLRDDVKVRALITLRPDPGVWMRLSAGIH